MSSPTTRPRRDPWVMLGLTVAAASAAVSSFDGLRSLAMATGWSPEMAVLFPLTVDSYAVTALRVWLSAAGTSERARRFARANAVGAILLSVAGNAGFHLVGAGLLEVTWIAVVVVGAVPPLTLALVAHLAVLHRQSDAVPQDVPGTSEPSQDGPRYVSKDALLAAAREADAAHRARTGKPITRDQLRRTLGVGGQRATEALRLLRAEELGSSRDEA